MASPPPPPPQPPQLGTNVPRAAPPTGGGLLAVLKGLPPPYDPSPTSPPSSSMTNGGAPPTPPPLVVQVQTAAPLQPEPQVRSAPAVSRVIFEVPKTMEKLRNDVGDWSLADDVGLMVLLEEVATNMKKQIRQVEREVDTLVHETSAVHVALRNSFTSFSMLSQTQFVENRVYDNDDHLLKHGAPDTAKSVTVADSLTDANTRHELLVTIPFHLWSCSTPSLRRTKARVFTRVGGGA